MSSSANELQSLKRRRTFLHPAVVLPALIGALSFAATMFVSDPLCAAAGVGGLGLAVFVAVYRATAGATSIVAQARNDLLQKDQREHFAYLRELRRKMRRDRDPRTGQLVTKLRAIYQHIVQSADLAVADYSGVLPEMHEQARELYDSCLHLLEHSFALWDTGRDLTDPQNRDSLAEERETILSEVQQSVDHLDRTMDELRKASLRRGTSRETALASADHSHLRDELSLGIETARAVEQRMTELEVELGMRDPD